MNVIPFSYYSLISRRFEWDISQRGMYESVR